MNLQPPVEIETNPLLQNNISFDLSFEVKAFSESTSYLKTKALSWVFFLDKGSGSHYHLCLFLWLATRNKQIASCKVLLFRAVWGNLVYPAPGNNHALMQQELAILQSSSHYLRSIVTVSHPCSSKTPVWL